MHNLEFLIFIHFLTNVLGKLTDISRDHCGAPAAKCIWGVCVCVCACARMRAHAHMCAQSCLTLCDPHGLYSPPGSSPWISQARIL